MILRRLLPALILFGAAAWPAALPAADWPQWGGPSPGRNMVSDEKGLPETFVPGSKKPQEGGIDPATTKSVRWAARIGAYAYGNPTVSGGKVFIGTDDALLADDPRLKRTEGGMVQCLDEATGKLLWRLVVPKRTADRLPKGAHYGQQKYGVCSSPAV
ncbi:MAG: PQQ-binding-like beta-propeller repeat protein, partial [Planctomycetota bacterium]|nr:PQQ-binding-like beta-propeller repeat protein [Planctomycetota bacterium]